jgi:hypothetical protein
MLEFFKDEKHVLFSLRHQVDFDEIYFELSRCPFHTAELLKTQEFWGMLLYMSVNSSLRVEES